MPHSIYEVEGAKTCAIEFRSFSKTAGFTGTRCGYTVVPMELVREGVKPERHVEPPPVPPSSTARPMSSSGAQRPSTPQRARSRCRRTSPTTSNNAKVIKEGPQQGRPRGLSARSTPPTSGAKTPNGMGSWEFFDLLLEQANVVTTPGAGFGPSGEGYIRMTAFGDADQTVEAVARVAALLKK